jgi:hypothetical protein
VFSFITKFTQLRGKVEGLNSPMECVGLLYILLCLLNVVHTPQFRGSAALARAPYGHRTDTYAFCPKSQTWCA